MKKTMTEYDFEREMMGIRPDNFSRVGLRALFEWFEQFEGDCDTEIEFDPIAICCEFTEYETAEDCAKNYFDFPGMIFDENGDETMTAEEVERSALEYLQDNVSVIEFDGGIIVPDF